MKKIILSVVALVAFAQAEEVVHYDQKAKAEGVHYDKKIEAVKSTDKVNHPNNELNGSH